MKHPRGSDPMEFDFYVSANRESAATKEVTEVVQEAGCSFYLPEGKNGAAADRLAASRSQAFVLLLTNDPEQTRFCADLLNFLPLGVEERRVIVVQFEECEFSSLIDPNLITDLTGVADLRTRKLRIIASLDLPNVTVRPDKVSHPFANSLRNLRQLNATQIPEHAAEKFATFRERKEPQVDAPKEFPASPDHCRSRLQLGYGTSTPPIDDPLATLVNIISEENHSANPASSLRMPKWLSREISAAQVASSDAALRDSQPQRQTRDIVEFGVGHPAHFSMGAPFIIDVLIYRQEDRRHAVLRAAEISSDYDRFRSAAAPEVARGSKLSVTIRLPWPTTPTVQTVYWSGVLSNVSFQVLSPKYAEQNGTRELRNIG